MTNIKVLNPKTLFIPFCMQHGIDKDAASSRLRCYWVSKHLKGSEVWDGSQDPKTFDVIVFQKYYMFPKQLKLASYLSGIKKLVIFDLCIGEKTLILTSEGWKFAYEIEVGNKVVTHKGRFKKVKKIYYRNAKVKKLKPAGLCEIAITGNHTVLSTKISVRQKSCLPDNEWVKVDSLLVAKKRKGDMVISLAEREYPQKETSRDLAWMLGYYTAEGTFSDHQVSFSMKGTETKQQQRIMGIIKRLGGHKPRYHPHKSDNVGSVCFTSKKWRAFFAKESGTKERKKIPTTVFAFSPKRKLSFLEGYISGDGYCNGKDGIKSNSISKKISFGIWQLFRDCGIKAHICYLKREGKSCAFTHKDGRRYEGKPQWQVTLNPQESLRFLQIANVYKKDKREYWKKLSSKNIQVKLRDFYYAHPIRKITESKKVPTYNFEVEEDNSYIADGIVVHNCDAEWTHPGRERPLKEMMKVVDFCTTSTEYIKTQIEQRYNHNCYHIPDRQDLEFHSNIKIHKETKSPAICWYGNRRTLATLHILKPVLSRLGREFDLTFRVILEAGQKFECPNVKVEMAEWKLETINKEILKCDLIVNPHLDSELELAKSNNKTTKGWALGMPVVDWTTNNWYEDIRVFLVSHNLRAYEGWKRRQEVEREWDVKISAKEMEEVINENLR